MKEKSFKNLLKNNIVSVIVLVLLISVVGVFAGNVYITDGDIDVDDDFTVDTNTLFANATSNNVGIRTTSPQANLHLKDGNIELPSIDGNTIFLIEDSTVAQMSLVGATSCVIQFGDAADENVGIIQYIHSSNAMTFRTSGAGEDMRIDSSGNVGIGTTSPDQKLKVDGSVNITGDIYYGGSLNSYSPLMFGKDSDVGYTRICWYDEEGYWNLVWFEGGVQQIEKDSKVCADKEQKNEIRRSCEAQNMKFDSAEMKCYEEVNEEE